MHPDFLLEFLTFSDCKIQSQGLFVQPLFAASRRRQCVHGWSVIDTVHLLPQVRAQRDAP